MPFIKCVAFAIVITLSLGIRIFPAHAEETKTNNGYMGLQIGNLSPTEQSYGARLGMGAGFGFFVADQFSIGPSYQYSKKRVGVLVAGTDFGVDLRIHTLTMDFRYYPTPVGNGLSFALRAGVTRHDGKLSATLGGIPYSVGRAQGDLTVGPSVAYDFDVGGGFSIGGSMDAMWVDTAPDPSYVMIGLLGRAMMYF